MERFDRTRRHGRPRKTRIDLESLEARQLMAYSPLGYSLPDLTVSGVVAPTATYGGPLDVQIHVRNVGASSMVEPTNLAPTARSNADALPTSVGVYVSPLPVFTRRAELVQRVNVPVVPQNSEVVVDATVTVPAFRRGLPALGRNLYVFFRADDALARQEADETNNGSGQGLPVLLQPALPELQGLVFDVPSVVQPGDWLRPTVKIGNFGTVNPGPFRVQLVVSNTPEFGPANAILTTWDVPGLAPLAQVPLAPGAVGGELNTIYDQANILTLRSPQVQVPTNMAAPLYVGVIVDPGHTIPELSDLTGRNNPARLSPLQRVQRGFWSLPPAARYTAPGTNLFPTPPFGRVLRGGTGAGPVTPPVITPVETTTASASLAAANASRFPYTTETGS